MLIEVINRIEKIEKSPAPFNMVHKVHWRQLLIDAQRQDILRHWNETARPHFIEAVHPLEQNYQGKDLIAGGDKLFNDLIECFTQRAMLASKRNSRLQRLKIWETNALEKAFYETDQKIWMTVHDCVQDLDIQKADRCTYTGRIIRGAIDSFMIATGTVQKVPPTAIR